MSEICPTTGFSKKSKERWPYLWENSQVAKVTNFQTKITIKSIDRGIKEVLKVKDSSTGEENRQNLIKHLRKIICSKIKDSTLEAFGSSQSGLSLIGGDIDLCLKVPDTNPKQILRRLKGLLDARGMEQITLISKARIPIIKFHDPKSGFDVDISINNSLALHNTELLCICSIRFSGKRCNFSRKILGCPKKYFQCLPRNYFLILLVTFIPPTPTSHGINQTTKPTVISKS